MSEWVRCRFLIALPEGPAERDGYSYRWLGLHQVRPPSPKGRRPPWFSLTHIGSGHRVCLINARLDAAKMIATEIAECGEWAFDGVDGWKNIDPSLRDKCIALFEKFGKAVEFLGAGGNRDPRSAEVARQIVTARSV